MAKSGLLGSLGQFNKDPLSVFRGPTAPEPVDQLGDSWQPHNPTLLGRLADAYLQSRGQEAIFGPKSDEDNLQEAMRGFDQNPLQAIRHLSRIPGHEADAWKMYEQYVDDKRMNDNLDRQNQLFDLQKQKYVYGMVANMMNSAAQNSDQAGWSKMRDFATNYGNRLGVDVSNLIPEQLDTTAAEYIANGAVPVAKQRQLEESNRHNTTREDQMQQGIDERVRHDKTSEGQGSMRINQAQERMSETQRHNRVTEKQGQTRIDAKTPKVLNTPRGTMVLDPTGTRGQIGTELWMKVAPGQWKRVK